MRQYKRLYNLIFVLFVVCAFFFVFRPTRSFITATVIEGQKQEYRKIFQRQRTFVYNQLVRAGKRKEADEFMEDPQARFLGLMMTDDEHGQLFGTRANTLNRRIRFLEENCSLISFLAVLLAYVVAYFGLWLSVVFCVRYVKGPPERPATDFNKGTG